MDPQVVRSIAGRKIAWVGASLLLTLVVPLGYMAFQPADALAGKWKPAADNAKVPTLESWKQKRLSETNYHLAYGPSTTVSMGSRFTAIASVYEANWLPSSRASVLRTTIRGPGAWTPAASSNFPKAGPYANYDVAILGGVRIWRTGKGMYVRFGSGKRKLIRGVYRDWVHSARSRDGSVAAFVDERWKKGVGTTFRVIVIDKNAKRKRDRIRDFTILVDGPDGEMMGGGITGRWSQYSVGTRLAVANNGAVAVAWVGKKGALHAATIDSKSRFTGTETIRGSIGTDPSDTDQKVDSIDAAFDNRKGAGSMPPLYVGWVAREAKSKLPIAAWLHRRTKRGTWDEPVRFRLAPRPGPKYQGIASIMVDANKGRFAMLAGDERVRSGLITGTRPANAKITRFRIHRKVFGFFARTSPIVLSGGRVLVVVDGWDRMLSREFKDGRPERRWQSASLKPPSYYKMKPQFEGWQTIRVNWDPKLGWATRNDRTVGITWTWNGGLQGLYPVYYREYR